MTNILVVTGGLNQDYQILDSIFAMDSHKESFWKMADPSKAFDGVKNQLKTKAAAIGGDAIINCMFEYRVSVADGFMGKKQVMEIFAYGTAVKRIQQKVQPAAQPVAQPVAQTAAPTQTYAAAPTTPPPQAYSTAPTTPPPQAYSTAPTTPPPNQFPAQGAHSIDDLL
jgi:hypothetical protein